MGAGLNCSPCGDQPRDELVLEVEEGNLGSDRTPKLDAGLVAEEELEGQAISLTLQAAEPAKEYGRPVHVSVALKDLIERAYRSNPSARKRVTPRLYPEQVIS